MSRSFGKVPQGRPMPGDWHSNLRARERMCIHREIKNADYGEVVFPLVREVSDTWDEYYHACLLVKEIRDSYYTEINYILNGRIRRNGDFENLFLESFYYIQGALSDTAFFGDMGGRRIRFEWLRVKCIKKIIKRWKADPFEALFYLTRHGYIEKAVRAEIQRRVKK
jgi:hypothetical protein